MLDLVLAPPATCRETLGADRERRRLTHRAERLEQVLERLDGRVRRRAAAGGVPAPLVAAIAGLSEELDAVRARLRALD